MNLTVNQRLTILTISEMMAHTVRHEITVKAVLPAPEFRPDYVGATRGKQRYGTMVFRGKRTPYGLTLKPTDILLPGWDRTDLLTDQEVSERRNARQGGGGFMFTGNACFNLWSPHGEEALRRILDTENLNPQWDDSGRGRVLFITGPDTDRDVLNGDDGHPLYPDIQIGHAVMDRHHERLTALAA